MNSLSILLAGAFPKSTTSTGNKFTPGNYYRSTERPVATKPTYLAPNVPLPIIQGRELGSRGS